MGSSRSAAGADLLKASRCSRYQTAERASSRTGPILKMPDFLRGLVFLALCGRNLGKLPGEGRARPRPSRSGGRRSQSRVGPTSLPHSNVKPSRRKTRQLRVMVDIEDRPSPGNGMRNPSKSALFGKWGAGALNQRRKNDVRVSYSFDLVRRVSKLTKIAKQVTRL